MLVQSLLGNALGTNQCSVLSPTHSRPILLVICSGIQVCGPAAPRSWPKRIPLKALRRGSPLFESGYAPTHAGKPSEIEPSAHIAAWTRVKKLGVARCLSGGKGCIPTAD